MRPAALLLVASALLPSVGGKGATLRACPEPASPTFHFGLGTFEADAHADSFVRDWYSKPLHRMGEPSLSCGPAAAHESYRFTWLRTFDHPIVVRVAWWGDRGELIAAELSGAGGYDPGQAASRVRRALGPDEWKALGAAIERSGFWTLSQSGSRDERGLDGAEWIVEGRRGDDYHLVVRWSPHDGPYRELGLQLVALSGLQVPKDRLY